MIDKMQSKKYTDLPTGIVAPKIRYIERDFAISICLSMLKWYILKTAVHLWQNQ